MADLSVLLGRGGYERSRIMPPSDALLLRMIPAENITLSQVVYRSRPPTLWVNGATGNDSNAIADVRAGGGSVAWLTIGRAAWGSTNRAAPNTNECAQPGDVVSVAAGTYESTVNVRSRSEVLYSPAVHGTAADPIRFVANGTVTLVARTLNGPVIGSNGKNYIEWYADVTQGHKWNIVNDYVLDGTSAAGTVNIVSDTGSIVFWSVTGGLIEGATVDGGGGPFSSNYNGVRTNNSTGVTIRNNTLHHFSGGSSDNNATGITLYGGIDHIVEHNYIYDVNSGIAFKDVTDEQDAHGNIICLNKIEPVMNGFLLSHTPTAGSDFYQNLIIGGSVGVVIGSAVAAGPVNDRLFNNTFYSPDYGMVITAVAGSGCKYWNNIISGPISMIWHDGGPGPAASLIDIEYCVFHNNSGSFYDCTDGTKTIAQWRTAYSGQDADDLAIGHQSITSDPQFVTPGSNFHLQGGSPAEAQGVDLGDLDGDSQTTDAVPAGCYVSGAEVIGVQS